MKRASLAAAAATAALLTAGTAAAQEPSLQDKYTEFAQNGIDLMLKGDLTGAQALYGQMLAEDFTGSHQTTISFALSNKQIEVNELAQKPGKLSVGDLTLSFGLTTSTDKVGYISQLEGLSTAMESAPADVKVAGPEIVRNTHLTVAVQNVETAADGQTATVNSTLAGHIDSVNLLKDLGLGEMPPQLEGVDVQVSMDCVSVLALNNGSFTVKSEECTGGIKTNVRAGNMVLPTPAAPK